MHIQIDGLRKSYGSNTVVDDLHLEIPDGEFLVLLGASGCGKTTTLRCLAGLEQPEGGTIRMGDRVVHEPGRSTPAHKREVGMVFQSYALWPHMTVRRNIEYPLRVRKVPAAERRARAAEAAELVGCAHLLDRYPAQLSGGQQQRIAVARGLVARPRVMLFDEPLSNLDAKLRTAVRGEIHQLHQELGFSAVFVTHDQSEALALGDRLAVMRGGRMEQLGTPQEVFADPATEYVADFLGMENRLELVRTDGGAWTTTDGAVVPVAPSQDVADRRAVLRTRPEDVQLHLPGQEPAAGRLVLDARVEAAEFGGREWYVRVATGAGRLQVAAQVAVGTDMAALQGEGRRLQVSVDPANAALFPLIDGGDAADFDGVSEAVA